MKGEVFYSGKEEGKLTVRELKEFIDLLAMKYPKSLDQPIAVDTEARCDQAHYYEADSVSYFTGEEDTVGLGPRFIIQLNV